MKIISIIPLSQADRTCVPLIPTLAYPDSSMVRSGNPVFLPDFDSSFYGHFYLAVKVSRLGKSIAERFAPRYYSQAAPAMAIMPTELIETFKSMNLPWTSAACFDRSIAIGDFRDYTSLLENKNLTLSYTGAGEVVTTLPARQQIATAIHEVSQYNSLKMGDFILVPLGLEPVKLFTDSYLTISSGPDVLLKTAIK